MFKTVSYDLWKDDPLKFSQKLGSSFEEWGFCAIKNHPVDNLLINEVNDIFKIFFSYSNMLDQGFLYQQSNLIIYHLHL